MAVQPAVDDGLDGVLVPEGDCRLVEKRRRQQEVNQPGLGNHAHVPKDEAADFAFAAPFDDGSVGIADDVADLPRVHHVREGLQRFIIERPELIGQGRRHLGQHNAAGLPGHRGCAASPSADAGQAFQVGDHVQGSDHCHFMMNKLKTREKRRSCKKGGPYQKYLAKLEVKRYTMNR